MKDAYTKEWFAMSHIDIAEDSEGLVCEVSIYANKKDYENLWKTVQGFDTSSYANGFSNEIKDVFSHEDEYEDSFKPLLEGEDIPKCNQCGKKITYPYCYVLDNKCYCKDCALNSRYWVWKPFSKKGKID